ncbi:replication protein A 70 kDa DNA-binding subunit isoform X1 [Lates japonicus]|uniref:Replication protein A 70 kDa DNA-binding subunit isoform X1 n=1 Tax=Lates japonicus TaxID=270547 RepID=A0AAD3M3D0_LATJO|nr:replication protein A 70 kDa DNA-binding subunit isoform X1 [Lates japonicus]
MEAFGQQEKSRSRPSTGSGQVFLSSEQGQVYYISKATLKVANKQYTTLKNDYEMTLHAHSSIVPCDDGQDIPTVHCDFVPIAELENRDKDTIIGKRRS